MKQILMLVMIAMTLTASAQKPKTNNLNVTDTEDIAASDYIDISDKTLVKLQKGDA